MAWLYILFSKKRNRYYIGSTSDIERRVHEHNLGITLSTSTGRPWTCEFKHQTATLIEARRLEYKLKRWKNRKLIEQIIKNQKLFAGG